MYKKYGYVIYIICMIGRPTDDIDAGGGTIIPCRVVGKALVEPVVSFVVSRANVEGVGGGVGQPNSVVKPHPLADQGIGGDAGYGERVSE